ncbi:MAG TPA: hypothetical protein VNJ08_14070 [Bacteriovoracaceae bacterium]|nr:hypothetical protein [Bacteriovoracaceae bacterium]
MKTKSNVSSQLLILALAGLVIVFMIQVAKADSALLAQSGTNQSSQIGTYSSTRGQAQVLQIKMPQKSLGRRLLDNTTLGYYQMFLGPTLSGNTNETYNVFQETMDVPRSGRAPLQSFHAVNLRHAINTDWAVGASLAAVDGYTNTVKTRGGAENTPDSSFFNARLYVSLPSYQTKFGTLFSTVSYEAPTSVISRNDGMNGGLVITESFALKSHSPRWTYGLMGQYYRSYFEHQTNVKPPPFLGGAPTQLQTVIVSGGPYATYRFNDRWQAGSLVTLDWDQRGVQTDSREFNNNLPHRARVSMTYFPQNVKYLQSVGMFSQALIKFRPETTALGAEFAVKF